MDQTPISTQQIARAFGQSTLQKGQHYNAQNRVTHFAYKHGVISAMVKGSRTVLYRVKIDLRAGKILDECSCPIGHRCKHAVASLLYYQDHMTTSSHSAIDDWFDALAPQVRPSETSSPPPPDSKQTLVYVLSKQGPHATLVIQPMVCNTLKSGQYGARPKPYNLNRPLSPDMPRPAYLDEVDMQIFWKMQHLNQAFSDQDTLLPKILDTGRCAWVDVNQTVSAGEPIEAPLTWAIDDLGNQQLVLADRQLDYFILHHLYYIDTRQATVGRLTLPGISSNKRAAALLNAPVVPPNRMAEVIEKFTRHFQITLPQPQAVEQKIWPKVRPTPCLSLKRQTHTYYNRDELYATLDFRYQQQSVAASDSTQTLTWVDDGKLNRIPRHKSAEKQAIAQLQKHGLFYQPEYRNLTHVFMSDASSPESFWVPFSHTKIPELTAEGWDISIDEDFPYQHLQGPQDWYADYESSGMDWFDVDIGFEVEGHKVQLLPILVDFIRSENITDVDALIDEGGDYSIQVSDKHWVSVPISRVKDILSVMVELFDKEPLTDERLSLPLLNASLIPNLDNIRHIGGERVIQTAKKLKAIQSLPPAVLSEHFQAELRPYQDEGVAWMQYLQHTGLGGLLADDMGLGKTVQTLAYLLTEKEAGRLSAPSLLLAPTSLMVNWRREAANFAPDLNILVLHGPTRHQDFENIPNADLVMTTYPLLSRDYTTLQAHHYANVICDEAQVIKNPRSQSSQIVKTLKTDQRFALTGTPMENHLGELWSIMDFVMPGLLGDEQRFRRAFRTPIEKQQNQQRMQALTQRIQPFLMRRTKEAVAHELPKKTEIIQTVELAGAQRDLYEAVRLSMNEKVQKAIANKGMNGSQIIILDALLKLRQTCCHPVLLKLEKAKKVKQSAKFDQLMTMLPELVADGRRILLFSQFTTMLDFIEKALQKKDIDYVKLTGKTRNRETPITRFQSGQVPVFLISLKAGGTGLNLTAADTVIHYDPWWNPAVEDQATDRAYRIGQDKPVFVYKFITAGTVEETILALQKKKRTLVQGLMGQQENQHFQLDDTTIQALFAPINTVIDEQ